jgi:TrpR-related protein YerC/YecD
LLHRSIVGAPAHPRQSQLTLSPSGLFGAFHCINTLEQKLMATMTQQLAPTRDLAVLTDELCDALLTPSGREEMRRLLLDLCTPAEIRTLAERWHVARLLDGTELSYRDIHDGTGVSTTTIVRVGRFLRQESNQGYRQAIDALGGTNAR